MNYTLIEFYYISPQFHFQSGQTFDDHFDSFITTVRDLENFVCAYLNALFMRKMKTSEALMFMNRLVDEENFVKLFAFQN